MFICWMDEYTQIQKFQKGTTKELLNIKMEIRVFFSNTSWSAQSDFKVNMKGVERIIQEKGFKEQHCKIC